MSAPATKCAPDLGELLAGFSFDTTQPTSDDVTFVIETFDVWRSPKHSFEPPVLGCNSFRLPDEDEEMM